jgi:hypothetical protein
VRRGLTAAVALLSLALLAPTADAAFHLMKIREVHSGGATGDYVELQMHASGQNFVAGHTIRTYDSAGNVLSTFTFPANVANGENQRTILVSDGGPIAATPDFADPALNVATGGGSVCFLTLPSSGIDCVAYGATLPPSGNPSPVGTPAVALGAGQSLERSIARGCATLLEASDDTDDSAADFAGAAPSPRPNAVAATETPCTGGGGGDDTAPQTTITKHPKKKTEKTRAKFKFKSSEQNSTFECKFDRKPWKPCDSPYMRKAKPGEHKFKVRATDAAGNTDRTPAKFKWRVLDA